MSNDLCGKCNNQANLIFENNVKLCVRCASGEKPIKKNTAVENDLCERCLLYRPIKKSEAKYRPKEKYRNGVTFYSLLCSDCKNHASSDCYELIKNDPMPNKCDLCHREDKTYDIKYYELGVLGKVSFSDPSIHSICEECMTKTIFECKHKEATMPNKLTPLDIEVLLHYWVCQDPYPRYSASAVQQSIEMFINAGLMTLTGSENGVKSNCKITEGGKLLVEALCSTPLPVQKWVMPDKE